MIYSTFADLLLSGKKYGKIYMDLPWQYKSKKPTQAPRPCLNDKTYSAINPDHYYPTMSIEEMYHIPIYQISEKNSVLFQWVTNPFLTEGLELMKYFGFKYVTTITWNKTNGKGGGFWFRGMTEHLLFGVRGKVKSFRSMIKNIQDAPISNHSTKPDLFRKIVASVGQELEPKIEIFAREEIPGWDQCGNQVKRSIALESYN